MCRVVRVPNSPCTVSSVCRTVSVPKCPIRIVNKVNISWSPESLISRVSKFACRLQPIWALFASHWNLSDIRALFMLLVDVDWFGTDILGMTFRVG